MKNIFRVLFLGLLLAASCTELGPETINEITDHYAVPADAVQLSAVKSGESVWTGEKRLFNLSFSGDATFETTLVGYDALLAPGQYVLTSEAAAKIGDAIAPKTKVNGQAASAGFVTVSRRGSEYQICATLDGVTPSVVVYKGNLPFTADPAPVKLTEVMSAQSNVANGTNSVTMNLATPGISKSYNESWQEVWEGEGGYLAIDLYSDDGYLHEGVYTPCAVGGAINPGEFGIGWDPGDLYGIGWEFTDWGTCWWKVSGGAAVAQKITSGIVTVTKADDGWQISWGAKYPQEYVFTGAIPALTKPAGGGGGGVTGLDYTYTEDELQPVTDQGGNVVAGVMKHPIHIFDKAGNEKAYLELLIAEGQTDYSGSYPSTSYASQPGQMADGWEFDGTAWGMGLMSGGSYYVNDAGEKVLMYAGQYTVEVKKIATGAYEFSCSAFSYKAAGPDYVPGGGGGASYDYTYTEDELQPVTDQGGNVVAGVMKHPIHIFDKAGNEKAYLELLIAEGQTDYSGSYPSTSYASQPGQMADGWEFDGTAWGMGFMSGGSYYVNDAGENVLMYAGQYTVDVTKVETGVYKFSCSAFEYTATGPDYVPGDNPGDNPGGDEPGDDGSDLEGIVLKITSGLTYKMEDQTASNTDANQQPLSGVTLWRVNVMQGDALVANFDLVVAAGQEDLAGSYTVMSYPDAAGKAGNGWGFAAWNMFGGCYYLVDGKYYFIPTDATVNVTKNSDGTLKFKFSGSVQNDDYSDGGKGGLLLDKVAKA